MFEEYMTHLNTALRCQNPAVKKQGEALFKALYGEFGEAVVKKLVSQKTQLVQKIVAEAKQDKSANNTKLMHSDGFSQVIGAQKNEDEGEKTK